MQVMLTPIEVLKAAAGPDLAAWAEEAGFRHVRGKSWRCALHRDRSPSVHEYPGALHCFSCGQQFDVVDLAALIHGDMRVGIKALAERYGAPPGNPRKKIPPVLLENAEWFQVGFRWVLERHLADVKVVLMSQEDPEPKLAESVLRYTRLIADLDRWGPRDLVWFYRQMKKRKSQFVSHCLQEAFESGFELAAALQGGAE